MQFYFSSDFPAIIKTNGVFGGKIDKPFKRFDLPLDTFIELCPLNRTDCPISFMIDEDFLKNPPSGIVITDLKGGFVIKFLCQNSFAPFEIISQQKFPFAVVTIFIENGLKIMVETPFDFFTQTLFLQSKSIEISPFMINSKQFVAVHFLEENLLICFLVEDKIVKVFSKDIESVCFDGGLKTTHKFLDIAKHTHIVEWDFINGKLTPKNTSISRDENYDINNLNENLLPYAFVEELLVGGQVEQFLSEDLNKKACHLKGFFGDYIGVFPPPDFRDIYEVGLVYCNKENLYYAEYFSFEMNNRKICNIKKADDK